MSDNVHLLNNRGSGKWMRDWMKRLNLSRLNAAELIGRDVRTIDSWVRKANPSRIPEPIIRLCEKLEEDRNMMRRKEENDDTVIQWMSMRLSYEPEALAAAAYKSGLRLQIVASIIKELDKQINGTQS